MTESAKLDPKTTAVLSLDCQKGLAEFAPGSERIYEPAGRLLAAVRAKGFPVIHVGIGFRPGYPEIHSAHPMFARIRGSGRFVVGTDSAAFHPGLALRDGEITIVKHRVSAFSGNDLEMILRAQGIAQLVLFGIATSGIVLSTVRQASDMDFRCVVVKDCCFDGDEEVHRVLTEKVFARQAEVLDADALIRERL
jgi:nicotinamidase-related amidase